MKTTALFTSLTFILFSLASCQDDFEALGVQTGGEGDALRFSATLERQGVASGTRSLSGGLETLVEERLHPLQAHWEKADTRAGAMTMLGGEAGVVGFAYDEWDETAMPLGMLHNKRYSFDGDILSAPGDDVRWSSIMGEAHNDNVRFCLWAPYGAEGLKLSPATHGGYPYMEYTVPQDAKDQRDIVTAAWSGQEGVHYGEGMQAPAVQLAFRHILTAVRFRAGFACKVTSLSLKGASGGGTYTFSSGWTELKGAQEYAFYFDGKECAAGGDITGEEETLMMVPQTLGENAAIELTYLEGGEERTLTFSLEGKVWEEGKMVTYTLHGGEAPEYVYLDLAAGDVTISSSTYSGSYYRTTEDGEGNPVTEKVSVSGGVHTSGTTYYIYQSTARNRSATGEVGGSFVLPVYEGVHVERGGGVKTWGEFITDNTDVSGVIQTWDNAKGAGISTATTSFGKQKPNQAGAAGAVRDAGREASQYKILVEGSVGSVNLIIEDIYSSYQQRTSRSDGINRSRNRGGISFLPASSGTNILTVDMRGDNRLGCVNYQNNKENKNRLVFGGNGTLTVGDTDYYRDASGMASNRSCSAIGGKDEPSSEQNVYGIVFNGGTVWAGATLSNCTAIGGGGNGHSSIEINGGSVTAVTASTGTAIGGGTGLVQPGGQGKVTISYGNVYAYNFRNSSSLPAAAIGGGGSTSKAGESGKVTISGGYVYAYSEVGTAIGGGSSRDVQGGGAVIKISGGQVIAKSGEGAGIGGGSSYTCKGSSSTVYNGGEAEVTISGNPIVRTGSIGGGLTGHKKGNVGKAKIHISGGDIQAQFVMAAAGAESRPEFTMEGGLIRGSHTGDREYLCTTRYGGAVYMGDGTFTMSGGRIENCSAVQGGAVYMESGEFTMNGGEISSCFSFGDAGEGIPGNGGAVYLNGGSVFLHGGSISNNYSQSGDGGGIYISEGSFTMDGESSRVSGNAAQKGSGGGIYITSRAEDAGMSVNLLHGSVEGNTAGNLGGGICVDMSEATQSSSVAVGYDGGGAKWEDADPRITGNVAGMAAGGLYVRGEKAKVTIRSGMIDANKVVACVKNQDVANEGGMVELIEGLVTSVTVTYHNNVGVGEESLSYKQKLVTDTNNRLRPNTFSRNGYVFEGWNSAADGSGDDYSDAQVVNLSGDVSLWAKWRVVEISQQISE